MAKLGAKIINLSDTYISEPHSKQKTPKRSVNELVANFCREDPVMEQSVLKPGVVKQISLPPYHESIRQLRKQRKMERDKTKGAKWFNIPATPVTDEIKNDLSVIRMRSILDRKHFYKRSDMKVLPKYFQVGTVMDDAVDFYHDRVPKKQRKQTLVDELLADAEFRKRNKKAYVETLRNKKKATRFVRRKREKTNKKSK